MNKTNLLDKLRAWPWLALALTASLYVVTHSPADAGLLLFVAAKLAWGAYLGYWVDRSMFPHARPLEVADTERSDRARYRRAAIVAAAMLGMALGV